MSANVDSAVMLPPSETRITQREALGPTLSTPGVAALAIGFLLAGSAAIGAGSAHGFPGLSLFARKVTTSAEHLQNHLNLFTLWHNMRVFQRAGIQMDSDDWLTLLGYHPA